MRAYGQCQKRSDPAIQYPEAQTKAAVWNPYPSYRCRLTFG
uniref:Uncharacterized protein n=1 Tax=Pseudomonas aeruginosa TaxID=287 RepID=A0A2L1KEE4_PSEAI|nr:Hypothetical protein [Pseudomonas aeruginosa]